jgi:hypothetical protein
MIADQKEALEREGRADRLPPRGQSSGGDDSKRPYFSADGAEAHWYLPGVDQPVMVPNPLNIDTAPAP